ncbi:MAG: 50S ribosomal protein L4 [Clostridia bacterium]|nr:50S ribosomal protein L4 [Clostridia bacterium]
MPNVAVFDMAGNKQGEMELSATVFGAEINEPVLHSVVRAYLLNQRQGTQSTKTRAEVSGGGKKPWRQKGTGRARQGSTRSPQWVHGGIAFGPKPRSWKVSINKKVKRIAMQSALSAKVAENELVVVDSIATGEFKTKKIVEMLKALGADKKALIVLPEVDKFVVKSASNIEGVKTAIPGTLNVYDILKYDMFIVAKDAVKVIEEVYA